MSLLVKASYRFEEFELDPSRRALTRDGAAVPLSPKAFDVLTYLVQNPGRVVTKEELLKAVWPGSFVEEGNLAQHISAVRKAMGDRAGYIVTVPGRGYQFAAKVVEMQAEEEFRETTTRGNSGEVLVQRIRERTQVSVEETQVETPARSVRWLAWAVPGVLLVAAAGWSVMRWLTPPRSLQRVEVADFVNLTGDQQLDHTLKTALLVGLGQSPYLQVMGKGEEHAALSAMERPADTPLLGETALEVCRRGNYQGLLRGRIDSHGERYGLSLDVVDCVTGRSLSSYQAQAEGKDRILDVLDQLAARARRKLGETTASIGQYDVPLREATTSSFEALQDYNTGSDLGNAGKLKECIEYLQKAADLDPNFAMVQAALGTAYYNLGEAATAIPYYRKAFSLSEKVTQPEKFYIQSNYYLMAELDLYAAARSFEEATRTYPNSEMNWVALANAKTQLGDFPAAIAAGEQALKVGAHRPAITYEVLARAYKRAGRYTDAKRTIAAAQADGKDAPALHDLLYFVAVLEQDGVAIGREIEWAKKSPTYYRSLHAQALAAADAGKLYQFEELMHQATSLAEDRQRPEFARAAENDEAEVYRVLGLPSRARHVLAERANDLGINYAILEALAGDIGPGVVYLRRPIEFPHETAVLAVYRPELQAALAMQRGDPKGAVAALEPARTPMETPSVTSLRAEAYLAEKDGAAAQAEYQRLIDTPERRDVPFPENYVAHVGLARALKLEGKLAESKAEYEKFLALWKDADKDVPVLVEAKAEYAKL